MQPQHGAAPRTLRRIYFLQRISGVQVHQAEFHRSKMPAVRGRRTGGKEGAPPRQYVLRLLELSQLRLHVGIQTRAGSVPAVRQPVPAGKALEIWIAADLSQQQQEGGG